MNRSVHQPGDSLFLQVSVLDVYQDLDEEGEVIHRYTVKYETFDGSISKVIHGVPEYELHFIF